LTPQHAILLAVAGIAAGSLNAVAGGGSLVSFPALLAAGLPGVAANVTNTVALSPGYAGGALAYRAELASDRTQVRKLVAASLIGAVLGSVLLLTTPASIFTALVPWLVLGATLLFTCQPWVSARVTAHLSTDGAPQTRLIAQVGVLLASIYGACFGAGLGIMLLAVLGSLLNVELQRLNGLKNALSLTINSLAMLVFVAFGPVRWLPVLIMAVMSLAGGFLGASAARRVSPRILRGAVIIFGTAVGLKLLLS
jgi:uncharacterized membrane protein YfcA